MKMNAVECMSVKAAKAIFIAFLILFAGFAATANVFVAIPGGTGVVPGNGLGEDPAELYRDWNNNPQILIDGAAPGVNDIYIGEPNVRLDIPIRSLKPENANDNDGDDILYNVTVSVVDTATTCWDSESCSWVDASDYILWDTDTVSPTFKEDSSNGGNALLIDGVGSKYIPWFYNNYNYYGYLDADNDQRADNDEFYRIWDDYKMYDGYQFDVAGDAPPGVYNISVEVTYIYQTYQNVSTQRLSGGGGGWYDPDNGGPWGTGDLGVFDYYFWEPYEVNGGTLDFNVPNNFRFRKRGDYIENNVAPSGAHWEAIPDLGYDNDNPNNYNQQGGNWDYHSNFDNDGDTSWDDGGLFTLNTVVSNWNLWDYNEYAVPGQSYIYRTVDQYPYNLDDGNGTWRYSGYEGDTVWTEVKTEIEYVEIHVEHGVYFNEPNGDGCELVPDPTNPYYLKAGDQFKKMYLRVNNRDAFHPMTDVYVNITLDDQTHFSLKHDWAWKNWVNAGSFDIFYYRMDALNGTPVDRYSGTITLTYTREGVRVTEDLPLEYILYFTPSLINYYNPPGKDFEVNQIIHTGQDLTNVNLSVSNYGNTLLENGKLEMDFSDFKHSGDEYIDPEGGEGTYTQTLEMPYLNHETGNNLYDVTFDVEIPNHWALIPGVYKLMVDYNGYYFNDGVLGEPTNYVKVWMKWYDDDFNDDTDMNAYCVIDTDGDESMDIFTDDETRPIEGIYMYVDVEEFDPYTPELSISSVSINGGTDTFEQGSVSNGQIGVTLNNNGEADIYDLYVELDLQGYFKGKQYYDGYNWSLENPVYYISALDIDDSAEALLDVEGIDNLLPPGTHRLKLIYTYSYDNGSTPTETSTDTGELYFSISVTDSSPDMIPTVSSRTGILRLGERVIDIDLYVNLANREYYNLSYLSATLKVGEDTPFIPGANATLSGQSTIWNKWDNPAYNYVTPVSQNLDNMYFNVNMNPEATPGTYYMDMTLEMYNDRTMTTLTVPTTLEVKIYPKIAKLRITDIMVSTGSISPGREFSLTFAIQNDGGETAREIYIEFEEAYISGEAIIESYENINPTGAKYPFSSDIMKAYIDEIDPYSTGTATFTVIGDLNIYPGVTYFQNIEFHFKDSTGYDHSSTDIVPIQSDSSTKVKVDGENYVWDTDREAWISETELAAEEVMDYMPWMISMVVIIWLVTLLIVFMFVIRPKYRKEQLYLESKGVKGGKRRWAFWKKQTSEDELEYTQDQNYEPATEDQEQEYTESEESPTESEPETSDETAPSPPQPNQPSPPNRPLHPTPKHSETNNTNSDPNQNTETTTSNDHIVPPVSLSPPAPHETMAKPVRDDEKPYAGEETKSEF
jgi:hypothetical protein